MAACLLVFFKKTNFFEKKVASYQKAGVMDSLKKDNDNHAFKLDEDF